MDKRKDPVNSVIDDFSSLTEIQQEVVFQTLQALVQLKRRNASKAPSVPRAPRVANKKPEGVQAEASTAAVID